jgi:hypothetical protein
LSCQDARSAVPAGSCSACDDDAGLGSYQGLLECLEGLADPRRKRGMRHRAAVVPGFAVAAVMACGARLLDLAWAACSVEIIAE